MILENIVALVAVRLKSQRLKKKALLNLYDKPLIIKLVDRIKESKYVDRIVLCTSTSKNDNELQEIAELNQIEIYRGDEDDVMSRFIEAASQKSNKTLIRITGDNPLTDVIQMDNMIEFHTANNSEYTYTVDLPHGTRSEIIDLNALIRCHSIIQDKSATEYMTWMLNRPDFFKVNRFKVKEKALIRPDISLTVDTLEDYTLMKKIYEFFSGIPQELEQIIEYYDSLPQYLKRNLVDKHLSDKFNNVNIKFKSDK